MMFRKLYWVTETLNQDGTSMVHGVYTSIPDLIRFGLPSDCDLRLSLVQLDGHKGPLGIWASPRFEGIHDALLPFVATDEFSSDQVENLTHKLQERSQAAA